MTRRERLRLGLVFLLAGFSFIPFTTNAQRGAGMGGGARAIRSAAVAHAPTGTARSRLLGTSVSRPVRSNVTVAGSPFGFFGTGNFGPGLAFAPQSSFGGTNNDFLLKAAIDPATQWRIATAERLFRLHPPVSGIAYYWPTDGYGYGYPVPPEESNAEPVAEQAPVSGQQQPIIIVQGSGQGNPAGAEQQVPVAAPEPPLPDVGQFTLVLRNGKKIDAIAFTKLNGKIIYVTPDGSRRTLGAGDLDPDATKEVNEEHGTPLQL